MSWLSNIFKSKKASVAPVVLPVPKPEPEPEPEKYQLSQQQQFVFDQAIRLMDLVNESMVISRNSTNPETKTSRLEFAKANLAKLQAIAASHVFIKLKILGEVNSQIARFESEYSAAGHYAQIEEESVHNYRQDVWRGYNLPMSDIITGWKFCATMQLRTPLRVISRHGEVSTNTIEPPDIAKALWEGIWLAMTDMSGIFCGSSMASSVGYIPTDGGEFLKFLKAVRDIVESQESTNDRLEALRAEISKSEWDEFVQKLNGRQAIYDQFFPAFLQTIPGLPKTAIEVMWSNGWTTPGKLESVPDDVMLSIKGIGPAKLRNIRAACGAAADRLCEYVDRVEF